MGQSPKQLLDALLTQPDVDIAAVAEPGALVVQVQGRYQHLLGQARGLQVQSRDAPHYDEQVAYATFGIASALAAQTIALLAQLPGRYGSGTDASPLGQARSNASLALTRFEATSAKFVGVPLNGPLMPALAFLEAQARSALQWAQAGKALLDAQKFDGDILQPALDLMRRAARS
ncbi:MAG: hypothetical protein K2Z81_14370 [Cyanobacteria bacterium]|nr:hypothetical protein [Cyanobacteriota bacterium]